MTKTFEERFEPFKGRYDIQPKPHELRLPAGSPRAWVAEAYVWEHHWDRDIVHPIYDPKAVPPTPRTFASLQEAQADALYLGLEWLEQNA